MIKARAMVGQVYENEIAGIAAEMAPVHSLPGGIGHHHIAQVGGWRNVTNDELAFERIGIYQEAVLFEPRGQQHAFELNIVKENIVVLVAGAPEHNHEFRRRRHPVGNVELFSAPLAGGRNKAQGITRRVGG